MTSWSVSEKRSCEAVGVCGLPAEILLAVITHLSVPASISFVQTCRYTYSLSHTRSFWFTLVYKVLLVRPIPLVSVETSGKDELRDAVVVAWKLHIKWTLRRDASITRWFTVGPGAPLTPQNDLYRELLGFTLFMADGKHLMVQVLEEEVIKLYDYTKNAVVWDSHWLSQLGCLDCTVYEGRLLLIFEIVGDIEFRTARIEVRDHTDDQLKSELVYTLTIPNLTRHQWAVRSNFIREQYGGCLIATSNVTDIAYVCNWRKKTAVGFEVQSPSNVWVACPTPTSTITAHELLIVYEFSLHVVIYAYKIEHIIPFMTSAEGDFTPALVPLSPSYTCRLNFEDQGLAPGHIWYPQIKELDPWTRKLRLLSRSFPGGDQTILTMSSFKWPPVGSDVARGAIILPPTPIPRTVIRTTRILNNSRVGSALWAYGSAGKTIAWMSHRLIPVDGGDNIELPVLKFAEVDGDDWVVTDGDRHTAQLLCALDVHSVGREFEVKYPEWLAEHGELLSMDLDDSRGRLALSMSDKTVVILEFV